jgi:hypothetical protein
MSSPRISGFVGQRLPAATLCPGESAIKAPTRPVRLDEQPQPVLRTILRHAAACCSDVRIVCATVEDAEPCFGIAWAVAVGGRR